MKEFIEGIGKILSDTAETVGNKAGEVVESQRIRNQLNTLKRSNNRDLRDMGQMIYDKFQDGEVIDPELVPICEEIARREDSCAELEKVIADMKGAVKCPKCGKPVGKGMNFCPYCGVPAENEEEAEEDVAEEAVTGEAADAAEETEKVQEDSEEEA
jgi:ssDNA-binding Zn-finger/Zn-ribbon topoisomerase 1